MQRVINRKLYDTDQAEQIASYTPLTDRSDFNYLIEILHKTANGEYFLHDDGGAATKWAQRISNQRTPGEEIRLLTDEEALDWCEKRAIDGEIVVEEFGHLAKRSYRSRLGSPQPGRWAAYFGSFSERGFMATRPLETARNRLKRRGGSHDALHYCTTSITTPVTMGRVNLPRTTSAECEMFGCEVHHR